MISSAPQSGTNSSPISVVLSTECPHLRATFETPRQLTPDIAETRRFLSALAPLTMDHFFQTFGDGDKSPALVYKQFASLNTVGKKLTKLNEAGAGVFATINETNGQGRAAKDIVKIRALYLDFDDPETAIASVERLSKTLTPSIVVESSPGLRHVYFLVSDLPVQDAGQWLKHLIAISGADQACSDISRVLRLPGFLHKKGTPFKTHIISISNQGQPIPYAVADLENAFGRPTEGVQKATNPKATRSARVGSDFARDATVSEGGRNSTLASLAGSMRHRGMSEAAIYSALSTENQTRCVPPLEDEEVKTIAASIASYPPSNQGDSLTGETPEQVIDRLSSLGAIQYDQVRIGEAKSLRIRPVTLDKMVRKARGDGVANIEAPFAEVDPWPESVNLSDQLSELVASIRRHVICDSETATAAALWVVMTYMPDQFGIAPLAVITAPEPRCGKSVFRRLIEQFVFHPLSADGMSAA